MTTRLEQAARQLLIDIAVGNQTDASLTALREALAEPQVDWKEEAMRLAGLNAKHVGELRKLEAEQAEQSQLADATLKPVAWGWATADGEIVDCICPDQHDITEGYYTIPLYTQPVRTKDLTDDELAGACGWKLGDPMYEWVVDIGRSAITADRKKNK